MSRAELAVVRDDEPALFRAVKDAELLLAPAAAGQRVTAIEEGERLHPNGVRETYRRAEFD